MSKSRDQVLRMLAMVPYLQSNTGVPVNDLAKELGVSARQIRDDLLLLMMTGKGEFGGDLIDVNADALTDDGVIYLRDAEFLSRPLRITAQEGAGLVVALRTLRASAGTEEGAVIDSALTKIESALGESSRTRVDVVVDSVDPDIRQAIQRGLSEGRRIELSYATVSRDDRTDRLVDPRRVFTERGRLYLEAWCLMAQDLRFFRLDRVLSATVTDQPVEHHDAAPRDLSSGVFTVGDETPYLLVRLHPSASWMAEYYPMEILGDADSDGVRTAKLFGADPGWLRRVVLRSAGAVAVIEPADMRDAVIASAQAALAAYDGDDDTASKE